MTNLEQWAGELVKSQITFVPQGRSRSGLDCWGVIWLAYKECLNLPIPSYTEDYLPEDIDDYDKIRGLFSRDVPGWQKVDLPKPGDVVLMRLRGRPIHVGLVLDKTRMLHIEKDINLCVEYYGNTFWRNRIAAFYRFNAE